jgi:molecular chaperone DnaK
LVLQKPIELLQSDDTYAAVVPVPFLLPLENETKSAAKADYHCVDPRSGRASFTFARSSRPRTRDARSDRQAYATLHLEIDETAPPLMERLELELAIDHDYVAHVDLRSTMRKHHLKAEIFDLEFTLRFPTAGNDSANRQDLGGEGSATEDIIISTAFATKVGTVRLRSNVTAESRWGKVPGDLVIQYRPHWFDERSREYSEWQKNEWVYYKDCPYCHRSRYEFRIQGCGDSKCLWRRAYPTLSTSGSGHEQESGALRAGDISG